MTVWEPHFVKVEAQYAPDGTELEPKVTFECRAEPATACRLYPACGCEYWDDNHAADHGEGHERVPRDECWLQGWFDSPCHCYDGEEYDDMGDWGLPAGFNRSGRIVTSFEDDSVVWHFVEEAA